MNFILWLIIGGIIGWVASLIMHTDAQQGIFLNIVVGIIGAMAAGFLLTPLFGIGTINQNNLSLPALFVSLLGSVILLATVNLFRRATGREEKGGKKEGGSTTTDRSRNPTTDRQRDPATGRRHHTAARRL